MDGRTRDLVQRWREDGVQDWVKPLSGWSLYPGLCLPTIAWLRENDPDTFNAAKHYFSVNDFLTHRLTGKYVTNPQMPAVCSWWIFTMLSGIRIFAAWQASLPSSFPGLSLRAV